jgi:3-oxoacyl-ACP reductase-like protein
MGLLSNLMSKIFSHAGTTTAVATGELSGAPAAAPSVPGAQPAAAPATPAPAAPAAPPKAVDVAAILDGLATKNPEKLDWKKSIVDLMKLVGMDSSFKARKQLAQELNYTGDPNDSASMNIWLHKQVLIKISENGGKVPQELLS